MFGRTRSRFRLPTTVITIDSIEFDLPIDEEVFSLRWLRNPQ